MNKKAGGVPVFLVLACLPVLAQEWKPVATLVSDAEGGETLLLIEPVCIPGEGAPFRIEAREGPVAEEGWIRYLHGNHLIARERLKNDFLAGSRIYQDAGAMNCDRAEPAAVAAAPPVLDCESSGSTVAEGQFADLEARAEGQGPFAYQWSVDGSPVPNQEASFRFGGSPGAHDVNARVTDAGGRSAACDFRIEVVPVANRPPTVELVLDRAEVQAGEAISARARATDPDRDQLSYAWMLNDGERPETGATLRIDTTGLGGGHHAISVRVSDGKDGRATQARSFSVRERIVLELQSARLDNVAKARLDEIALRMVHNPRLRATLTGRTAEVEAGEGADSAAFDSAGSVRDYLVKERGVPSDRLVTLLASQEHPPLRVHVDLFVP